LQEGSADFRDQWGRARNSRALALFFHDRTQNEAAPPGPPRQKSAIQIVNNPAACRFAQQSVRYRRWTGDDARVLGSGKTEPPLHRASAAVDEQIEGRGEDGGTCLAPGGGPWSLQIPPPRPVRGPLNGAAWIALLLFVRPQWTLQFRCWPVANRVLWRDSPRERTHRPPCPKAPLRPSLPRAPRITVARAVYRTSLVKALWPAGVATSTKKNRHGLNVPRMGATSRCVDDTGPTPRSTIETLPKSRYPAFHLERSFCGAKASTLPRAALLAARPNHGRARRPVASRRGPGGRRLSRFGRRRPRSGLTPARTGNAGCRRLHVPRAELRSYTSEGMHDPLVSRPPATKSDVPDPPADTRRAVAQVPCPKSSRAAIKEDPAVTLIFGRLRLSQRPSRTLLRPA